MALSNAEKQKRWREKRNELAVALTGKPNEVADNILRNLGADQARKVSRALDKRLRDLKSDCPDWAVAQFGAQRPAGPHTVGRCDCGNPEFLPKQERLTAAFCGFFQLMFGPTVRSSLRISRSLSAPTWPARSPKTSSMCNRSAHFSTSFRAGLWGRAGEEDDNADTC